MPDSYARHLTQTFIPALEHDLCLLHGLVQFFDVVEARRLPHEHTRAVVVERLRFRPQAAPVSRSSAKKIVVCSVELSELDTEAEEWERGAKELGCTSLRGSGSGAGSGSGSHFVLDVGPNPNYNFD